MGVTCDWNTEEVSIAAFLIISMCSDNSVELYLNACWFQMVHKFAKYDDIDISPIWI